MKAILITGYNYNEHVSLVDVKETEKSYMADGFRFRKGCEGNGQLGYINASDYCGPKRLYPIDNEIANRKLEEFNHKKLEDNICAYVRKGLTGDEAQAIAKVLGITA